MITFRRSRVVPFALMFAAAACGGSAPPPPVEPAPQKEAPAVSADTAPAGEAKKPAVEAPAAPAPKPLKEQIIGKWAFDLASSDPFKKTEEDAKKKAGKDDKKLADLLAAAKTEAAKEWVELSADTFTSYASDKAVLKVKYEVAKEQDKTLHLKPVGKEEVSKKDPPKGIELVVTVVDDSTVQIADPKKGKLTYKRK